MQKVADALFSQKEAIAFFASQGFVTKYFLIFIIDEVKNFVASFFFKLLELVTYWDPCIIGGVYILESSEVLKWQKVFAVSSSTGFVEFREKSFVLDLKLLFTIVNCFSKRFFPKFFYCETNLSYWFSYIIISCLIYYSVVHDIDICLF